MVPCYCCTKATNYHSTAPSDNKFIACSDGYYAITCSTYDENEIIISKPYEAKQVFEFVKIANRLKKFNLVKKPQLVFARSYC
jgi:hypothetical protein